ncbi:MAG: hypothetical protein WAO76_09765 [Georgfuchsia sp.]
MKMTLCPIAIMAGRKKYPAFKVRPLKGVVGDYKAEDEQNTKQQAKKTSSSSKKPG